MIVFILTVILYIVITVNYTYKEFDNLELTIIAGFISSIVGCFIGVALCIVIGGCLPVTKQLVSTQSIISINMGSEINGSFILGTGQVRSDCKYYFYKQDDMGIKLDSVDADSSHITQDSEYPEIEIYKNIFTKDWYKWVGFCADNNSYIIRVPEGSIVQEIKL